MNDDLIALLRRCRPHIADQIDRVRAYENDLLRDIDAAIADLPTPDGRVTLSDVASLQRWSLGGHCDSFGQDRGAEMEEDDEGEFILLADVLRLGTKP